MNLVELVHTLTGVEKMPNLVALAEFLLGRLPEEQRGPMALRLGFEYRDYSPAGHQGWSNPSAVLENEHHPSARDLERAMPKARRKLRDNGREENCDPGTEVGKGKASPGIKARRSAR